jgi:hypothetical protein
MSRRVDKNGHVSWPKCVFRPGQKCPTTNKKTKKETIAETIASPSPLPASWAGEAAAAKKRLIPSSRKSYSEMNISRKKDPLISLVCYSRFFGYSFIFTSKEQNKEKYKKNCNRQKKFGLFYKNSSRRYNANNGPQESLF